MTTVALIDAAAHPAAAPFYRLFPFEQLTGAEEIKVDQVRPMRPISLEAILIEIRDRVPDRSNVLIVSHGTEIGLSVPLFSHHSHGVRGDHRIMAAIDDAALSDSDLAQTLLIPHPQGAGGTRAHNLRALVAQVKAKNLARVELRACNTGIRPDVMQTIKAFFGATRLGAPDIRDAYAQLNPGTPNANDGFWERWLQTHTRHHVYEVPNHGRLALAVTGGAAGQTSFGLSALVDKRQSVEFWIDVYLSRLHSVVPYSHGNLPIHALFDTVAPFPLIFPGDEDAYVSHIQQV